MGNDASKNLKRKMTMRKGRNRSDSENEYSAIDIRERFERMPKVSAEEREIIKSSWKTLQNNVIQKLGWDCFIDTFDCQFKPPIGVTPVFNGHGEKMMKIVAKCIECLEDSIEPTEEESQILWDFLIENGRLYLGYGALPMYFDVMGTNFVIAVRQSMDDNWYEALEYNWLQFFKMISHAMMFGWNLQRADEQKQASKMSTKRQLGFSKDS